MDPYKYGKLARRLREAAGLDSPLEVLSRARLGLRPKHLRNAADLLECYTPAPAPAPPPAAVLQVGFRDDGPTVQPSLVTVRDLGTLEASGRVVVLPIPPGSREVVFAVLESGPAPFPTLPDPTAYPVKPGEVRTFTGDGT